MKKTFTLLAAIIICIAANAQNKPAKKSFTKAISKSHSNFSQHASARVNNVVYRPAKRLEYSWDSTNTAWVLADSTHYGYSSVGNNTNSYTYYLPSYNIKDTFTYNAAGYQTADIEFSLNGSAWDTSYKAKTTYNAQNQITLDQTYFYDGSGTLIQANQDVYTYTSGQETSVITQSLNIGNSIWGNTKLQTIFYGGNNQPNKIVDYNWVTNAWQKSDSIVNITLYNWTGNINTAKPLTYTYVDISGSQQLDSLSYDAQTNQTKDISYSKQGANWVYSSKQTDAYTYDVNNNITQQIEYNYGASTQTLALNQGSKWVYSGYTSYNSTTGINQLSGTNDQLLIYPNPSNGTFNIKATEQLKNASISITDVLGREVYNSQMKNASEEINISNNADGIYYIIINNNGEQYKTKVMVNK